MAAAAVLAFAAFSQPMSARRLAWNKPFPPFRIVGPIYYVGSAGLGCYLIHTPAGDILLDAGLPEMAGQVEGNIAKLGFRAADIRILLNTHAHFDHAGGLAALKRKSGAKLYASPGDAALLRAGTAFPAVRVDHLIRDGEPVSLGGVTMTAHLTPGHTPGCTTWSMPVTEGGRTLHALFFCSISVADNRLVGRTTYPGILADYERSFALLKTLPCDIFLAPHTEFFHMQEKIARMRSGAPDPFIEPGEFQRFLAGAERDFEARLAQQRAELSRRQARP
jgi:metallo-beta-lactamase class B